MIPGLIIGGLVLYFVGKVCWIEGWARGRREERAAWVQFFRPKKP